MKTLRKIGMALFALFLCVNLVACGDDEDENANVNPLVGTWKVSPSDYLEEEYTFNADGTLLWYTNDKYDGKETTSNNTYTLNGNQLRIVFNNNDDYTEGTITFSGRTATYHHFWADCDGAWKDETMSTITLTRK